MKTNFRKNEGSNEKNQNSEINIETEKNLTQKEFEDYIIKSGAKGSFMIYRSEKKDDELGIDEI